LSELIYSEQVRSQAQRGQHGQGCKKFHTPSTFTPVYKARVINLNFVAVYENAPSVAFRCKNQNFL